MAKKTDVKTQTGYSIQNLETGIKIPVLGTNGVLTPLGIANAMLKATEKKKDNA